MGNNDLEKTEQVATGKTAPSKETDSPWTEGDIPRRKGNCNVLLIAPHGHPKDDTNTGKLARQLADRLDCYAIINEKYRKWYNAGLKKPDPDKFAVDLYRYAEATKFPKTKSDFIDVISQFKDEILKNGHGVLIFHIHGIDDENIKLVGDKIEAFKNRKETLHAIIGYGQRKKDDSRLTAMRNELVIPVISALGKKEFNVDIAPVEPIYLDRQNKKRPRLYCGNHKRSLNQYFCEPKAEVQSLQIEFRKKGVRNNSLKIAETSEILAQAIKPFVKEIVLDSAVQKGKIRVVQAGLIDLENRQFMSRLNEIESDKVNFEKLVESVKNNGILNNVIVRMVMTTDGMRYQLISGFRRIAALKASMPEEKFAIAKVPARILDESVSDDEAYQVSFAENLARKDLSLWEVAKACAEIKERKIAEGKMSSGEIEEHLSTLIERDTRTVRRYLKLASIENSDVIEAIHLGNISPTDALEIVKKELGEDDIAALLAHIEKCPKTTRSFARFQENRTASNNGCGGVDLNETKAEFIH